MGAYAKKTRKSRMMRGGEKPSNANGNVGNQNELPPEVTSSSQTGNQTEDPPSSQAGNQTDDPPSSQAGNQTEDQAAAKKSEDKVREAASGAVTLPEGPASSQAGNKTEDPPSSQAGNQTDDPPSSQAGNQTEDQAAAKKSEDKVREAASGALTNAEKGITKESLIALLNKETNPDDKIKKAKIDLAIAILNETKTFTPEYLSSLHVILSKQT